MAFWATWAHMMGIVSRHHRRLAEGLVDHFLVDFEHNPRRRPSRQRDVCGNFCLQKHDEGVVSEGMQAEEGATQLGPVSSGHARASLGVCWLWSGVGAYRRGITGTYPSPRSSGSPGATGPSSPSSDWTFGSQGTSSGSFPVGAHRDGHRPEGWEQDGSPRGRTDLSDVT